MLQLRALNHDLVPRLLNAHPFPDETLEQRADRIVTRLRKERMWRSADKGLLTRMSARLDQWIRTDAPEYLDQSDYAAADKVEIVARLGNLNRLVQANRRFLRLLKPHIEAVQARGQRPVRILELASGAGDFALALARKAQRQGLPLEIHGSDYLDAHVAEGNRKAAAQGLPVSFRNINAFDMQDVAKGEFDIIFMALTMHHFTPGHLARMVAEASARATQAVVGLDGHRGLELFGLLPGMLALNPHYGFMHDTVISMRKMYSEPELELIAKMAAPAHRVRAYPAFPGYSVLEVVRATGVLAAEEEAGR